MSDRQLKKLVTRLNNVYEGVYNLTNRAGKPIYVDFQKLPPRTGSDYYKFITRPISLHTVGRNIKKLVYKDAQGFINDLAQISWNARHYNEPGSEIYENALILDRFIKDTAIPRLALDPKITSAMTLHYPDLGPLEEYGAMRFDDDRGASASPFMKNEDYDDDDHSLMGHGYSGAIKLVSTPPKPESGVRRGRPPIIDKPYELRIKSILKLFKRVRHPDDENHILTSHFERLPDKGYLDYYEAIAHPISLHEIKTKVRSRKYNNVQQFLDDLALMLSNNKLYYAADPGMTNDILLFEKQAEEIIEKEMLRPDKDFIIATNSGNDLLKTPLDQVTVHNHTYKVGDWVLIRNPNDAYKPICGQIFRLWSADGIQYTNVCWYIRPEQTCHRVDRLFYMNEVCKTGEYLDHLVEDIVAPCYVIFLTHYQKGDIPPNLLPEGTEWFICEFRYNANTYAFNRIRTWKACLPDEIRHIDQPIVPINEPRKLIKFESPIKHLLTPDAQDASDVAPTPGPNKNGPPLVGAVFSKPPYYNDELGQCSTSPHVSPVPEYDDQKTHRKAYIFTPVSQLKSVTGSGIYSSSGTRSVAPTYIPGKADDMPLPAGNSYESPYSRSLQQQQQQQLAAAPSPYMSHPARRPFMAKPYSQPELSPAIGYRESTPSGQYQSTTSLYSHVLQGGVVSYMEKPADEEEDEEESAKISEVSESLIAVGDSAVWFRAPPAIVTQRMATPVGHSAKYLAWKLQKSQRV